MKVHYVAVEPKDTEAFTSETDAIAHAKSVARCVGDRVNVYKLVGRVDAKLATVYTTMLRDVP